MDTKSTVEDFSGVFLSKKDRANIWSAMLEHAISPPEPFTASGIARGLSIHYESVRRECVELEEWGFIQQHKQTRKYQAPSETMLRYVRTESDFWVAVQPMVNFILENYPDV